MGSAENSVQKAIKEYLEWSGYTVYRINNSGTYNQKRRRYIFHGKKGVCDLIALKEYCSPLFIECKSEGEVISTDQSTFMNLINQSGGKPIGMCVNSFESFANRIGLP